MIYLASTSPRRKILLREKGVRFKILKPSYHEKRIHGLPAKIVKTHAIEKALSCLKLVKQGIILSADTIVYWNGCVIGKPKNMEDAVRILLKLQDQWHTVFTGVAVLRVKQERVIKKTVFVEKTKIRLQPMTKIEINRYFRRVNPLDKAGAYAIQSKSASIVKEIRGSFSNAVGLPMERLKFLVK